MIYKATRKINQMKNHTQALVFDWDGTLIDSIARITASLQHASEICAVRVSAEAARNVIGLGLQEAIEQLHPGLPPQETTAIGDSL